MPSYERRWEIIELLGQGGQGKVYSVRDRTLRDNDIPKYLEAVSRRTNGAARNAAPRLFRHRSDRKASLMKAKLQIEESVDILKRAIDKQKQLPKAALKVLHAPQDARDPERAAERIQREMNAMAAVSHPNLLKILDCDPVEQWFVSEFHASGSIHSQLGRMFKSNFPAALKAFRPFVEGVAELHKRNIVHRDIKPNNIFLASDGRLVLGDFGLVIFTDEAHTRISATLENIGSRDWMPPWAIGVRLENIRPTFDIFSLGKVLWSLVSGSPFLRLWYFKQHEFDVEKMFQKAPYIHLANQLFAQCIVEHEEDCLPNASALLVEVDRILLNISIG